MKKSILMFLTAFMLMSASYANDIGLKELVDFTKVSENIEYIDVKSFEPDKNSDITITSLEIEDMNKKGVLYVEFNLYYLDLRIKLDELINKGNIKISSGYENDLYFVSIYSSKYGELNNFKSKVRITIPYDIDEESEYITMYGVDENEQIVNLKGFMNEDAKTVSVKLKNIDILLIPVVNKIVYKDLDDYDWAKKFIEESAAKGIVSGKQDGVYAPEQYITRAEFTTLLLKTLDLDKVENVNRFKDVSESDWYYSYVITADYYDLTAGIEKFAFFPDESITRRDVAVMVGKTLNKFCDVAIGDNEYSFSDEEEIDELAMPYLEKCLDMELVSGYEDGSFKPKAYTTRAEAAVIVNKLFNIIN